MKEYLLIAVIVSVLLLVLLIPVIDQYIENENFKENAIEVDNWNDFTSKDNTIIQGYIHSDYPVPYICKDGQSYDIVYLHEYYYHSAYNPATKSHRKVIDKDESNCVNNIDISGQKFNKVSFQEFKFINIPVDKVGTNKYHYFIPNNSAVFVGYKGGKYYIYFGIDKSKAIEAIGRNW